VAHEKIIAKTTTKTSSSLGIGQGLLQVLQVGKVEQADNETINLA
jgi:hypothetical protein